MRGYMLCDALPFAQQGKHVSYIRRAPLVIYGNMDLPPYTLTVAMGGDWSQRMKQALAIPKKVEYKVPAKLPCETIFQQEPFVSQLPC